MALRAEHVQAAKFRDSRAKRDVGTTTGHVGRDRHLARVTGILDNLGFAAVVLRVQDLVRNAFLFQEAVEVFGLLDGSRTHEERLALLVTGLDFCDNGLPLGILGLVDQVLLVLADAGLVGRDDPGVHVVDLDKFGRFGFGRTGHARKLLVHAEVVLERDGRKRLVLAADLHLLLGLDGLVHTVGVTAAFHESARVLVHDHDLAVTHDIVHVLLVEVPCAERLVQEVHPVGMLAVEVRNLHQALDVVHALLGELDVLVLLVDGEILVLHELLRNLVGLRVLVGRILGRAADDERGTGLVDQDGVHFVHNAEVELALHQLGRVDRHVVAQVVEAELIVGTVGDVAVVARAALFGIEPVHDKAHGKAQELVHEAHLLRVTAGEVVVHRHHVHAVATETVQVDGEGCGKGLTFTGRHFGNRALVEHEAADHLHVERHHAEGLHGFGVEFAHLRVEGGGQVDFPLVLAACELGLGRFHRALEFRTEAAEVEFEFRLEDIEDTQAAVTGFLAHGKRIDLDILEGGAVVELVAEFRALRGERRVVERLERRAGLVNLRDYRAKLLNLTFMGCPENLVEDGIYYAHRIPL